MKLKLIIAMTILSGLSFAGTREIYLAAQSTLSTNDTAQTRAAFATAYYNYSLTCATALASTNVSPAVQLKAFSLACRFASSDATPDDQKAVVQGALYSNSVTFLWHESTNQFVYAHRRASQRDGATGAYVPVVLFLDDAVLSQTYPVAYAAFVSNRTAAIKMYGVILNDAELITVTQHSFLNPKAGKMQAQISAALQAGDLAAARAAVNSFKTNFPNEFSNVTEQVKHDRIKARRAGNQ